MVFSIKTKISQLKKTPKNNLRVNKCMHSLSFLKEGVIWRNSFNFLTASVKFRGKTQQTAPQKNPTTKTSPNLSTTAIAVPQSKRIKWSCYCGRIWGYLDLKRKEKLIPFLAYSLFWSPEIILGLKVLANPEDSSFSCALKIPTAF